MRRQRVEIVIIGGGPAGLVMSYYLSRQDCEHLILEQGRIGEHWRSKRWDSLHLVGPNWQAQLPGLPYDGKDPDGFMHRDELVQRLERYAQMYHAPVRCHTRVNSLEPASMGDGYQVHTDGEIFVADQVVIATGGFHTPNIPPCQSNLPQYIYQLSSSEYRYPNALPLGAVLVVGSGESGCQIAEELRRNGRDVYLCVGSAGWLPRRYRGKDTVWWSEQLGIFKQTVDTLLDRHARNGGDAPQFSGQDGGHDLNLHTLGHEGVILLGHLKAVLDGKLILQDDVKNMIAKSDESALDFKKSVDEYIAATGIMAAKDDWPTYTQAYSVLPPTPILKLDMQAVGITTVLWATGYRPEFRWVHLPLFDEFGYPIHRRGVTNSPGLYFLGLNFLHTLKSAFLFGVGEDAAYLASVIATQRTSRLIR